MMDELRAARTNKHHRKIVEILTERFGVPKDKIAIQAYKRKRSGKRVDDMRIKAEAIKKAHLSE